jgi:hypothetical protein
MDKGNTKAMHQTGIPQSRQISQYSQSSNRASPGQKSNPTYINMNPTKRHGIEVIHFIKKKQDIILWLVLKKCGKIKRRTAACQKHKDKT